MLAGTENQAKRFTLDGEPVESIDELAMLNDFDSETIGLIWTMDVGDEIDLGGGAFASAMLRRLS